MMMMMILCIPVQVYVIDIFVKWSVHVSQNERATKRQAALTLLSQRTTKFIYIEMEIGRGRELTEEEVREKTLPRANFSYGCSLCPFALFLGFSFLSKVFLIQFFFCHTDLCLSLFRSSVFLFFCFFFFFSRSFAHYVLRLCALNQLTYKERQHPVRQSECVCYQKSKHTHTHTQFFALFAGYTLPLFIYNFLFFIFSFSSLLHFLPSQSDPDYFSTLNGAKYTHIHTTSPCPVHTQRDRARERDGDQVREFGILLHDNVSHSVMFDTHTHTHSHLYYTEYLFFVLLFFVFFFVFSTLFSNTCLYAKHSFLLPIFPVVHTHTNIQLCVANSQT